MRYYQVKIDFYEHLTNTAYFEGAIYTQNELLKRGFTHRDLKPSKCNIFRVIETPQKNTQKFFGIRRINKPSLVKIIQEE